MRRQEKARMDLKFINQVLNDAKEIYVAFTTDKAPYVLPLNFALIQNKLYIHCALEGRKLECIKKNPHIGFSIAVDIKILREKATTNYRCVSGTGKAHIVENKEEKRNALDAIAIRYAAKCSIPATDKMIERTGIICIDIEEISGKQSPEHVIAFA